MTTDPRPAGANGTGLRAMASSIRHTTSGRASVDAPSTLIQRVWLDPCNNFAGSGNQTRSINVDGASTLARPVVARLIDEALARNPVPFAPAGRGSVVIRSTSAKKRRSGPT